MKRSTILFCVLPVVLAAAAVPAVMAWEIESESEQSTRMEKATEARQGTIKAMEAKLDDACKVRDLGWYDGQVRVVAVVCPQGITTNVSWSEQIGKASYKRFTTVYTPKK